MTIINLNKALDALKASEEKAKELGVSVSTAIVDDHGVLVAFSKMDGALIISPKYSQTKAYTAAVLKMATADLGPYAVEGKPYFGFNTLFSGEQTPIPGGIPVKDGTKVIGAVGVGGSADVNQDVECAKAAVAVIEQ